MGVNKVIFGALPIMDISDSTVTPETLADGAIAYDATGERITGTLVAKGDEYIKPEGTITIYEPGTVDVSQYKYVLVLAGGLKFVQSNITASDATCALVGNGVWVLGADDAAYYSADGKTWTQGNYSNSFEILHYANGVWVGVDAEYGYLCYSTDGINWTRGSIAGQASTANSHSQCLYYVDGLWFSGGSSSRTLYSTDNGMSWSLCTGMGVSTQCVHYADGLWVIGDYAGLYYSTDGISWTKSNITSGTIHCVYYANGTWVAAGANGLYYSSDGKTWTLSGITVEQTKVLYGNGLWVSISANGIITSADGMIWATTDIYGASWSTKHNAKHLCYINGLWVVFGTKTNQYMWYSSDGSNWSTVETDFTVSMAYHSNGMLVLGCGSDGVWYSNTMALPA